MATWQASVTWTAPTAPDAADALMDALDAYAPALQHHADGSTTATLTVEADGVLLAAEFAIAAISGAAGAIDVTGVEVLTEEAAAAELARPQLPPLAVLSDVARILGVSRQRAVQLAQTDPDFPAPVLELPTGRVYAAAGVEAYARRRDTSTRTRAHKVTAD